MDAAVRRADRLADGYISPVGGLTDTRRRVAMLGPGTGIAPFRAFLQERQATGAKGKNWLFFGDQHERFDFLYRDELMAFHKTGLLTRPAFTDSLETTACAAVSDTASVRSASKTASLSSCRSLL